MFIAIEQARWLLLSTTETRPDGTTLQFETEFTFEALDRGTLMTMVQRGLPTEEERNEHSRGFPNAFDRLEEHVHALADR